MFMLKVVRSAKGWPTCSCLKRRGKLKIGLHVHARSGEVSQRLAYMFLLEVAR